MDIALAHRQPVFSAADVFALPSLLPAGIHAPPLDLFLALLGITRDIRLPMGRKARRIEAVKGLISRTLTAQGARNWIERAIAIDVKIADDSLRTGIATACLGDKKLAVFSFGLETGLRRIARVFVLDNPLYDRATRIARRGYETDRLFERPRLVDQDRLLPELTWIPGSIIDGNRLVPDTSPTRRWLANVMGDPAFFSLLDDMRARMVQRHGACDVRNPEVGDTLAHTISNWYAARLARRGYDPIIVPLNCLNETGDRWIASLIDTQNGPVIISCKAGRLTDETVFDVGIVNGGRNAFPYLAANYLWQCRAQNRVSMVTV